MIRIGVYCLFIRLIYCGSKTLSSLELALLVPSILSTITPMSVTDTSVAVGVGTIFREAAGFLLGLHYLTLYGAWGLLSDVSVG